MSILDLFRRRSSGKLIPEPKFKDGIRVKVIHLECNSPFEGVIEKSIWHYKLGVYHYYLRGKTKRYPETDLEPS